MMQRLLSFLFLIGSISAQSFFYSYIDPCQQTTIRTSTILQNGVQGFQVSYYNKTKFFTLEEVINGDLEKWTQDVYRDFENLFPCAVRVAEEVLSSVIADNVTEQFSKSDISNDPTQVNYAIRSTKGEERWVTQFNSVYTSRSFDNRKRHDGNFNFTDDFRKTSMTYGQGFRLRANKQSVQISASGLTYQTFEGWDWLLSASYAKSLRVKNPKAAVITGSYGVVSGVTFGNITALYAMRYPAEFSFGKVTFSNYIAYTLLRYYEGNIDGGRYLLLRSPIIFFPTVSFDWKIGTAFTFNIGVSMGYNTVVNDYGERNRTISILFGTYF
tara:strand:+ start:1631 stop:2611 length:981 start_codon:yes stop_codon:yes gene_type:complete